MRNKFDSELAELNNSLTLMGALCENAISMAVKAFTESDNASAKIAIEAEKQIDVKEREIENQCFRLLLQQQPVAKDLRIVSSALKMITDIERIGDQASDIASLTKYADINKMQNIEHIRKMGQEAIKMVTDSIDAFVRRDIELAEFVIRYDDNVDNLFNKVKCDIIDVLKQDDNDGEAILDILMIAKYLERIGDHATNIAEWVSFSITGKHEEE